MERLSKITWTWFVQMDTFWLFQNSDIIPPYKKESTDTVFKMTPCNEIQKKVSQTFQPHYSNCLSVFSQKLQMRTVVACFLSKLRKHLLRLLNIKNQSNNISTFTGVNFTTGEKITVTFHYYTAKSLPGKNLQSKSRGLSPTSSTGVLFGLHM